MKKKESPFIKVRRNLFNSNDMAQLMAEEGATGAGTYILIACYLSQCENAEGSMKLLNEIAAKAHKSVRYVEHIIKDYDLFNVSGNSFTCKLVTKSMHIVTEICCGEDEKECQQKCDTVATDLQIDGNTVATDLQASSFSPHLTNVRTRGRINRDRDRDRNRDKSGTGVPQKETITTTTTDFHTVVDKIFSDNHWLDIQEKCSRILICTDKTIREFVRQQFVEEIEMNGCYDDGEPFTVARAKRYFTNWVRVGKPPRNELNMKINAMLRGQEVQVKKKKRDKPFDGFGTIDREGRRRGPHGEIVPMNAPPCMDIMMTWNGREWE